MNTKTAVLTLNGHEHDLAKLLDLAAQGPLITVDLKDVDLDPTPETAVTLSHEPNGWQTDDPIFFKYQNKFIPLRGAAGIRQLNSKGLASVKGRLLSTPALKKSRLVDPSAIEPDPSWDRQRAPWQDSLNKRSDSGYRDRGPRTTSGDSLRTRGHSSPHRSGNPKQ